VGQRLVAKPSTKEYGILSVAFQLYSTPTLDFKIPSTVFFPQPKVKF
jgi:16S rRNA A1518/A1519 N6-dimethyltransferase RsmA/KsgA/DIM1 with predicted DNA glycosylase/AP lyase activity